MATGHIRKRKLKDVKKKLADISYILEGISAEDEKYLTLMPHLHSTDGFFIAVFRKNGGDE